MDAVVGRGEIHRALEVLKHFQPVDSTTQILVEFTQGQIRLSANDTYSGGTVTLPITCTIVQKMLLNFQQFHSYISKLQAQAGDVTLTVDETFLHLKQGRGKGKLRYISTELYSETPTEKTPGLIHAFSINALVLKTAIEDVAFAAAKANAIGAGLVHFTCILVKPNHEGVDFVASDTFRMAHATTALQTHNLSDQALFPALQLNAFVSVLPQSNLSDEPVFCWFTPTQNYTVFAYRNMSFFVRTVSGKWPAINGIYSPHYTTKIVLPTKEVKDALRLCSVYESQEFHLDVRDGELVVGSGEADDGGYETTIPFEGTLTAAIKVTLNLPNLVETINAIKTEHFTFMHADRRPVLFIPQDERVKYTLQIVVR